MTRGGTANLHSANTTAVRTATDTNVFEIDGPNPYRRYLSVVNQGENGDILYVFMADTQPKNSDVGWIVLPFNWFEAPMVADCPSPVPYNGRVWGRWATAGGSSAILVRVQ